MTAIRKTKQTLVLLEWKWRENSYLQSKSQRAVVAPGSAFQTFSKPCFLSFTTEVAQKGLPNVRRVFLTLGSITLGAVLTVAVLASESLKAKTH